MGEWNAIWGFRAQLIGRDLEDCSRERMEGTCHSLSGVCGIQLRATVGCVIFTFKPLQLVLDQQLTRFAIRELYELFSYCSVSHMEQFDEDRELFRIPDNIVN